MKILKVFLIIILLVCIKINAIDDWPVLKGPYLGQKTLGIESKNFVEPVDRQIVEKAKTIARHILIIDCHSHNLFQLESADKPKQVSFSMLKQSGVKGIVQSFPLDFRAINYPSEDILKNIIDTKNKIKKESLNISLALKSSDFSHHHDDSLSMMLGIEYFKGIFGNNIKILEKYHKEGVRVIGIVRTGGLDSIYLNDNLTEFGSELIGEMNRLGIICDITHLIESAQIKIIEASKAPVILSHTGAYRVVNSGFNVTDTTLTKLTAKGGIICVTFFSGQLSRRSLNYLNKKKNLKQLPRASIEELVDQIDYLKNKVGIDYIGIGSDYGGSGRMSPTGLETINGFPMIIYHMLKRNYSTEEIEKVMGLNFIRFLERVENKAELQKGKVNTQQIGWPVLKGPYLGQKPPGMTPEIFAPGIISTGQEEFKAVFSPDGKELYYQLWGAPFPVILMTKEKNGAWTKPEVAPFSGHMIEGYDISPDGKRMFITSRRPLDWKNEPVETWQVWISEQNGSVWGDIRLLSPSLRGYPAVASNGNLYLATGDIWISRFANGEYGEMIKLGNEINTEKFYEEDLFIARDESYLLFCRRDDGFGSWDIFVSFRKPDGSWTKARNMGEPINSKVSDVYPFVTSDGKYLFFSSRRTIHPAYSKKKLSYSEKMRILNSPGNGKQDIYWVDAKIINHLKPKELR